MLLLLYFYYLCALLEDAVDETRLAAGEYLWQCSSFSFFLCCCWRCSVCVICECLTIESTCLCSILATRSLVQCTLAAIYSIWSCNTPANQRSSPAVCVYRLIDLFIRWQRSIRVCIDCALYAYNFCRTYPTKVTARPQRPLEPAACDYYDEKAKAEREAQQREAPRNPQVLCARRTGWVVVGVRAYIYIV